MGSMASSALRLMVRCASLTRLARLRIANAWRFEQDPELMDEGQDGVGCVGDFGRKRHKLRGLRLPGSG